MPEMTDPMDALNSFQPAFSGKVLDLQKGTLDPTIFVHRDMPAGEPRLTYARARGGKVLALVIITMAEPIDGERCFAIGYAVPPDQRGKGLAAELVTGAITELQDGLARNGVTSFYVEAVVGKDNIASQKVAAATLGDTLREGVDSVSGKPVLIYARRFAA